MILFFFFQNRVMGNNTLWIAEMNYGICTEWRLLLNAFSLLLIAAINWGLVYLGNMQRCPNFLLTLILLTWMVSASKTVLHIPTLFYLLARCPFTQLTETSPMTLPLFLNLVKHLNPQHTLPLCNSTSTDDQQQILNSSWFKVQPEAS